MKLSVIAFGLFLCGALLAGCGPNQAPVYDVNLNPTPTPAPTAPPQPPSFNSSATSPLAAGSAVSWPSASGFTGSFTVPVAGSNVPAGTNITITLQSALPSGVTAFPGSNPVAYVGLQTTNTINVAAGSSVQVTVPPSYLPPSTPLSVSCYGASVWNLCAGPVAMPSDPTNTTTTLTNGNAFTMNAGTQYWFAVAVGGPSNTTVP